MFDGLKRLWGRIVSMFNYTTLRNIIGKDVALSQAMIDAINEWKRMLVGNAEWCDDTVESLKLEEVEPTLAVERIQEQTMSQLFALLWDCRKRNKERGRKIWRMQLH